MIQFDSIDSNDFNSLDFKIMNFSLTAAHEQIKLRTDSDQINLMQILMQILMQSVDLLAWRAVESTVWNEESTH